MLKEADKNTISQLDFDETLGITELDDYASEKYSGGAFTVNDGIQTRIEDETSIQFAIDQFTTVLDIRNTNPGANDPRAGGHNFEVIFLNAAGDEVAFGNVRYGRGVFQEQINAGRELGATAVRIRQGEIGSDCECPQIF